MKGKYAFTLMELLTVIAIVSILASLTYPAVISAKNRAREAPCASNLRQLFFAYELYAADHDVHPIPALITLASLDRYIPDKEAFVCPVEERIQRGPDGSYPARIGYSWADPAQPRSAWRISYMYVRDYVFLPSTDWNILLERPNFGLYVCPWHGKVVDELPPPYPSLGMPKIEGPLLRMCFDGHLQRVPKRPTHGFALTYPLFDDSVL
jgi:prepilin-type N-terminal cleavage/methylation domain-containing protein